MAFCRDVEARDSVTDDEDDDADVDADGEDESSEEDEDADGNIDELLDEALDNDTEQNNVRAVRKDATAAVAPAQPVSYCCKCVLSFCHLIISFAWLVKIN